MLTASVTGHSRALNPQPHQKCPDDWSCARLGKQCGGGKGLHAHRSKRMCRSLSQLSRHDPTQDTRNPCRVGWQILLENNQCSSRGLRKVQLPCMEKSAGTRCQNRGMWATGKAPGHTGPLFYGVWYAVILASTMDWTALASWGHNMYCINELSDH
jgi:hypothetical protein